MGHNTEYLGHVEIVPGLNQAEYDYLRAFAYSRRCYRPGGPYAVTPAHPYQGDGNQNTELYNRYADDQPGYWCDWVPCPHGCCLQYNGIEKFYNGGAWLQYLIDHFLRSGAQAERSGDQQFSEFTFDHRLDGFVVGERQDTRELFALIVRDDEVDRVVLRDGDPEEPWDPGYRSRDTRPWLSREPRPWADPPDYSMPIQAPARPVSLRTAPTRRRPAVKRTAKPPPTPE